MVIYSCELCGFNTKHTTNYEKHCLTRKHLRNLEKIENENNKVCESKMNPIESQMNPIESQKNIGKNYLCKFCDKIYSTNSNLHKHLKTCKVKKKYDDETDRVKAENERLKEEVNKLKSQQSNTTNNINITNYIKNDKVLNYLNSNHSDVIEMDSFINKLKNDTLLSRDMMECFITCYNHGGVDSFGTTLVKYLNQICKQLDINIFPLCCSDSNLRSHKEKNEVGWETVIDTKKIEEIINEIVTDIFLETDTMIPLDSRERKKICNIVKKSYDMSSLKIMEDFSDNSDVYNPLE